MAEPLPLAYFNGAYLPLAEVRVSPLDRGFLFGDGVYEVIPAYGGRLFHLTAHLQRLQYSFDGIRLTNPYGVDQWTTLLNGLVQKNGAGDQALYLQVTRGADRGRDHGFPRNVPATVFAMCTPLAKVPAELLAAGARAITLEDLRWRRCDIKSTALLGNVLLRQSAADQNCHEAVLLRDGYATEGTASSLFIVAGGAIITPPKSRDLLPSITRDVILELAAEQRLAHREARIPAAQLRAAEEIWLASSTRELYAVSELDGRKLGRGAPGPIWRQVYDLFQRHKRELAAA
ncbi:MAG: D-amino acid aminotransferase [Gammaproteobacteria bacterium]|nr:D-amino acid aminotransferase [Gammaproteobacteria bacterium]MDE1983185.1 D-amino acid aminotransferase [Gammaproteobacteria bacterium]MDE2460548.1 D-amino acid aminotransferase [Gammaproteobacteria bacterium]